MIDLVVVGIVFVMGNKIKNGVLGVKKDLEIKVNSVVFWVKNKGCCVGISISVSVDYVILVVFYVY